MDYTKVMVTAIVSCDLSPLVFLLLIFDLDVDFSLRKTDYLLLSFIQSSCCYGQVVGSGGTS